MFQLPVVHSKHADSSAALGAAMQAAAVHSRAPVGDYCAAVCSAGVANLTEQPSVTGDCACVNPTVYVPNKAVSERYQQLYQRSSRVWDLLFSDRDILQMPRSFL